MTAMRRLGNSIFMKFLCNAANGSDPRDRVGGEILWRIDLEAARSVGKRHNAQNTFFEIGNEYLSVMAHRQRGGAVREPHFGAHWRITSVIELECEECRAA